MDDVRELVSSESFAEVNGIVGDQTLLKEDESKLQEKIIDGIGRCEEPAYRYDENVLQNEVFSENVSDIGHTANTTIPELVSDYSDEDGHEVQQEKGPSKKKIPSCNRKICKQDSQESMSEWLQEASAALLSQHYQTAVHIYTKIVNQLNYYKEYDEKKLVLIKYAFGCACMEKGTYETLMQAVILFEEILQKHSAIKFPLAFYGLGRCYCKLNRFKKALDPLKEGVKNLALEVTASEIYKWPGSTVDIDESKPEKTKILLEELIVFCQKPPRPDAVCRHSKCDHPYKIEIYYTDPDFKGFVQMACKEHCCLHYHVGCWKNIKEELHKNNDKDFLGSTCLTPDCRGIFTEILHIDSKGVVAKQFNFASKNEILPIKCKQKKSRPEKKMAKKKKKKHVEVFSTQSVEGDQKLAAIKSVISKPPVLHCDRHEMIDTDYYKDVLVSTKSTALGSQNSTVHSTVNPTRIDLEHIMVLKKHEDEEETQRGYSQKADRHRDKKKDKKKIIKKMNIDEFLGDKAKDPLLLHNEYVQRLDKLREYRQTFETETNHLIFGSQRSSPENDSVLHPMQILKNNIYKNLDTFIRINGPVHLDDPKLMDEIARMSPLLQEIILLSGGIKEFLLASEAFALINETIYVTEENVLDVAGTENRFSPAHYISEFLNNNSNYSTSLKNTFTHPIENRLDTLDSFEIASEEENIDSTHSVNGNDCIALEDNLFEEFKELKEDNCAVQECVVDNKGSSNSVNFMCDYSASGMLLDHPIEHLYAEELSIGGHVPNDMQFESKRKDAQNHIHSKYYRSCKRILKFIPYFSEDAQKELLCLLLNIITRDNVLMQYQQHGGVNLDVENLEKSFIYIAGALRSGNEQGTQTTQELDSTIYEKIKMLEEKNEELRKQLSNYTMITGTMKQAQKEYQISQFHWQQEHVKLIQKLNTLNFSLQLSEKKREKIEKDKEEMKIIISQLQHKIYCQDNEDEHGIENLDSEHKMDSDSRNNLENNKTIKTEATSKPSMFLSLINCVNNETNSAKPEVENSNHLLFATTVTKKEASDSETYESSHVPIKNSFEKVMIQLQTRFPKYTRIELGDFVKLLRSRRGNTLTGLTIDAIVIEVSKIISQMTEKGTSTKVDLMKNVPASTVSSLSSHATMGLDRISDLDNAWMQPMKNKLLWKFQESEHLDPCVICHEEMIEDFCQLECHHCFHNKCIRDWFQHQSTCPTCRVHSLLPDEFPSLI